MKNFKDIVIELYSRIIEEKPHINENNLNYPISKGFKIIKKIKENNDKKVFIISNGNEYRICKILSVYSMGNEVEISEMLSQKNLSPTIYKTGVFTENDQDKAYIEMEMLNSTIYEVLQYELSEETLFIIFSMIKLMLNKLIQLNVSHGDFHWENIGIVYDKNKNAIHLKLIDLELGDTYKSKVILEIVQLIRTLNKNYTPLMNNNNREVMKKYLIELYTSGFGKLDENNIEKLYNILKN